LTKKTKRIPGTTHANVLIPSSIHEQMKAIQAARHRTEGYDPTVSRIYAEAAEAYIRTLDMETGLPRPPAPSIVVPQHLPVFAPPDEGNLFEAMDRSWMMLWACTAEMHNQHVSRALTVYAGRSREDFLRLGWADLLHPDDRERVVQICLAGFRTKQAFTFAYRLRRFDGIYGYIADTAAPRRDPDGRLVGYLGSLHQFGLAGGDQEISFASNWLALATAK
jgi:PAS domain-containing protein